jgi:hypothetical protein
MTTKDMIQAQLEGLDERTLVKLYRMVKEVAEARRAQPKISFMEKLRGVSFEGPPDFSENLDKYLSGEKRVEDVS